MAGGKESNMTKLDGKLFHLAHAALAVGSVIEPGNWGRLIQHHGWHHEQTVEEMALEAARRERFASLPSRVDCAFAFLTIEGAKHFRNTEPQAFGAHILHQVRLQNPEAATFIANVALHVPQGELQPNCPDNYWRGAAFSGERPLNEGGKLCREVLTLSPLILEKCFN